jgi:hypothetical protein
MKIKDILKESPTDVVARFYKEASADSDRFYNVEDVRYKEKNSKYYEDHFKQWFNEDIVPVFTKPVDVPQKPYTIAPGESKIQSPGYRGLQNALASAGLPYNHNVQKYSPAAPTVMSAEMDACRNNNSQ